MIIHDNINILQLDVGGFSERFYHHGHVVLPGFCWAMTHDYHHIDLVTGYEVRLPSTPRHSTVQEVLWDGTQDSNNIELLWIKSL